MYLLRIKMVESFGRFSNARKGSNDDVRLDRPKTTGTPKIIKKPHWEFSTDANGSTLNY